MFLLTQQRFESLKGNFYELIQIVLMMDAIFRLKKFNIDNLETIDLRTTWPTTFKCVTSSVNYLLINEWLKENRTLHFPICFAPFGLWWRRIGTDETDWLHCG